MPGHDVGHVLKDLQVLNLQLIAILLLPLIGLLQFGQVLKNIPSVRVLNSISHAEEKNK